MTHPARAIGTSADLRAVMGTEFEFSAQQFAAISAPLEPAVIIAGAGSGKTEVMAARVVYLVATGQVRPEEVLGLTFTTKATSELIARIRTSLRRAGYLRPLDEPLAEGDEEPVEPTVATYNAYAANLLTEHGLRIGHEPDTRVIADASRYQLAARAIGRHRGRIELLTDNMKTVIGYLLQLDAQLSEHLVSPAQLRAWQAEELPGWLAAEPGPKGGHSGIDAVLATIRKRAELLGLVEDYRALKAELGLMDFSDQISRGAQLATESPEVGALERAKFRVVLLDEYQDTSVAQALMLSALFSGTTTDTGRGHPVMAVGDPNQAIYGWRGASVSNILGFGDDFPPDPGASAEARVYSLTVNRRSERRILSTANELAAPLYADERTRSAPLEPKPGAGDGEVRAALLETYDDELAFLVAQVKGAHEAMGTPLWKEIGVLTRDNAHAADVYDALTSADIPVEIVGINGLLRLPEVAEVVATLQLLHDLTANASMLTLLAGPRWAVGTRDLALLGQRARHLAAAPGAGSRDDDRSIEEQLAAVVEGTDPTDLVSLSDAIDDPGPAAYSPEARERFALLSGELRYLRGFVGEPLLDLIRRIIEVTGIELELAASGNRTAESRRENLDTFVKAVAEFQSLDGQVSLPALLAYLQAEDELGNGLDAATPSVADSVKLLTVHRAKGLEWDVVFLPGVCKTKFPNTQGRTQWLKGPAVLPSPLRGDARDLPMLEDYSEAAVNGFGKVVRAHDEIEQLRLGYVAFTRARRSMLVSAHWWKPGRKKPMGPSPYLLDAVASLRAWGQAPEQWCPAPDDDAVNPVLENNVVHPWPVEPNGEEIDRRLQAAALVRSAMAELAEPALFDAEPALFDQPDLFGSEPGLSAADAALVAEWDGELERLLQEAREARADTIKVPLPSSLSATSMARLRDDPEQLAADLARPMPRKPSPSARFGTRFHAWVENRFGQQQLVGLDEVPGRGDAEIDDDTDLQQLIERFNAGPFADRTPFAIEPPFALVLGGQVIRGRIDAVYETERGFLVVDWKTNRQQTADPLQLAIYRVAWAELQDVPVESVEAAFYYVRTGDLVEHADLPDRSALEDLVTGPPVEVAGDRAG
ncbi:MAG TPA: UvrD-helicase domain-containing protein [Nocardioidaceae bacterium]|nr:UvrD-helicase domain-containing protein [Nocardioidaceae bacterium]